jgi:YfdX protein
MIQVSKRRHLVSLALGVALISGLHAFAAEQVQKRSSSQRKVTEVVEVKPGKNDTAHNIQRVSRLANQILEKIQGAQDNIAANKLDLAKIQLSQAEEMLDNIQQTAPTAKVIDTIKSKRKELQTSEQVSMDLVPLDAQLIEVERVVPVPQAKEHLSLAKKSLAEKNNKEASQHLMELENSLIYAEADLPVSRTRQDVLSAESLLGKNKPEQASKVLQDSLKHIQVMAAEADQAEPLQEVQQKPDLSTTKKHPKQSYALPTR